MSIDSDLSSAPVDARGSFAARWFGGSWVVPAFLACSSVFFAFPSIDLAAARAFVHPDGHFALAHDAVVQHIHIAISTSARLLVLALFAILALSVLERYGSVFAWAASRRRTALYVLVVLALGPGLIVNAVLKDHWGRARPAQIEQFGGERVFTRAFVPAHQCERNCAFVSGHAAYATLPIVGWFIARRRRARRAWLIGGLSVGIGVGVIRMAMGGHFLSDTVIAIFITWFAASVCARLILTPPSMKRSSP